MKNIGLVRVCIANIELISAKTDIAALSGHELAHVLPDSSKLKLLLLKVLNDCLFLKSTGLIFSQDFCTVNSWRQLKVAH